MMSESSIVPSSLESYTHTFLFTRIRRYLEVQDDESAIFMGERLITMIEEQRRIELIQLNTNPNDPTATAAVTNLTHSLDVVNHLLVKAHQHLYNTRIQQSLNSAGGMGHTGGSGGGGGMSLPNGSPLSGVECHAGGASYGYHILKSSLGTEENQLLFAQCCLDLHKYAEAEATLLQFATHHPNPLNTNSILTPNIDTVPGGAHGFLLLGRCALRSGRDQEAKEWFKRSLQLDPLCWSAWTAFAQLGGEETALGSTTLFQVDINELESSCQPNPTTNPLAPTAFDQPTFLPSSSFLSTTPASNFAAPLLSLTTPTPCRNLFATPTTSTVAATPKLTSPSRTKRPSGSTSTNPTLAKTPRGPEANGPTTPRRVGSNVTNRSDVPSTAKKEAQTQSRTPGHRRAASTTAAVAPKKRLPEISETTPMQTPVASLANQFNTQVEDDPMAAIQQFARQHQQREQLLQAGQYLTQLFQTLAEGFRLQQIYESKQSISLLNTLPSHHRHTHLVSTTLGRCHFDLHDYRACQYEYEAAKKLHPCSLVGMDFYSTALWHLRDSSTLSTLALWCLNRDSLASESWIVVGNVFSLAKEPELSLKFFRRAIQCNPHHPYACTLSAHEYMSNDDFDRAQIGYRLAIQFDQRFYTAWYGLGNLYMRQEKYQQAIYHFKRAIQINPHSSVLYCYLGMTYQSAQLYSNALKAFEHASKLESNNPLAKYHQAHVHLAMGQPESALAELEILKELIPRESNVHFLMGQIEKKFGHLDRALHHFVRALDLDPKDRSEIKTAIDQLHSGQIDEDEQEEEVEQEEEEQEEDD